MNDPARSIFFGLRTNVQFFASRQGYAALEVRLKVFSLLYDQVVVEKGVYEALIGETGSQEFVTPEPASVQQLQPMRTRKGTPFGMTIQREGSDQVFPLMNTTLVKAYRAQFYTILRGAVQAKADWIGLADFSPGGMHQQVDDDASQLAGKWNWDERDLAKAVFLSQPRYLRDKTHDSLNRDLARAVVLGLALAPDGIHQPLLTAKVRQSIDVEAVPAGAAVLSMLLPDVRRASWDDVGAIRQDKGLQRLRHRMRELEAGAESEALLEQSVREAVLRAVDDLMPSWRGTSIRATLDVIASTVPGVSTAATAVSAGKDVADTWKDRHHWTATLLRARKRLAQTRT